MKKLIAVGFILVFIGFSNKTFAQEVSPTPSVAPTQTPVKYDLAFPGMLPDNPLYKLKILRDKITLGLISDPMKKMDYYLLLADKGILASAMLIDKKEANLAIQTAYKAENNYTLLTYELKGLRKKPNEKYFKKLETAALKHQQVLASLEKKVSKDQKKSLEQIINFSKTNLDTVEKYKRGELMSS